MGPFTPKFHVKLSLQFRCSVYYEKLAAMRAKMLLEVCEHLILLARLAREPIKDWMEKRQMIRKSNP